MQLSPMIGQNPKLLGLAGNKTNVKCAQAYFNVSTRQCCHNDIDMIWHAWISLHVLFFH